MSFGGGQVVAPAFGERETMVDAGLHFQLALGAVSEVEVGPNVVLRRSRASSKGDPPRPWQIWLRRGGQENTAKYIEKTRTYEKSYETVYHI